MWQYRNYSDELYHHKYIERISVPGGGYRYVYPGDKKGSGNKSPAAPAAPVTKIRSTAPNVHTGSKVKTAPASSHPYRKAAGKGDKIFVRDIYNKMPYIPGRDSNNNNNNSDVSNKNSGKTEKSSGGIFDKALDKAKGIIDGILDGVNKNIIDPIEAEIWSKKFNMPKELLPAYDGRHVELSTDVKKRKKNERQSTGSKSQTR